MNNLISNFEQILAQATEAGLPKQKRRGILREYLQTQFIDRLYAQRQANKLSFVGGTSLRLLRDLPRFSEDLDFDNLGLSQTQLTQLINKVVQTWEKEDLVVEMAGNQIKFLNLLKPLKISSDPREKLTIKFDSARQWVDQQTKVVLLNRFGMVQQVVTNTDDQVLVQKLVAYVERPRTQARDIFDIIWLFGQGAKIDEKFAKANRQENIVARAKQKFSSEGISLSQKKRLQPFLFVEHELSRLNTFGKVLEQLSNN